VRVLGMWAAGVPDTLTPEKLAAAGAGLLDEGAMQALHDQLDGMRILRRSPRLAEIAATATFLASDMASALTGTFVNATGMFPS
jgi:enoyl-[acyl-carrier-protein] reductase (NADH)